MSYDPLLVSDRDRLRFAIGDITTTAELRADATLQALIDQNGYLRAVALAAEGLASEYAQRTDRVALPSGLSVAWSERVAQWNRITAQYRRLATEDDALANASGATPVSASVAHRVVW